ncbi:LLM class flavin-dependent oxidoreductase [Cytobacillus sp. FSL K6-0265]|uniref:LLM class flavin-dependent oxidoreductase n=1 Tax=Cytobacillus sp. FSL K6-0265 TaxID=2921448 RepID=UPI0030F5F331
MSTIKYSVLDLAPVLEGGTPSESLANSRDLAKHVEKLGYTRYWLAEHHNMPGIASSATSIVISDIARATNTIRVGSGGIMLPNHSSLVIAEQFGTLETLYPGRIDLGLGRAPGTDQLTAAALRRTRRTDAEDFPQQVEELRTYFDPSRSEQPLPVRAVPGEGLNIPIWLLGSSGYSAQLAGQLGLPFSFASHFSPDNTLPAIDLYHRSFKPSDVLKEPYVMVGVNIIAGETDEEGQYLASSLYQTFLGMMRNKRGKMLPPIENMDEVWTPVEKQLLQQQLGSSIIGGPETVKEKLEIFLGETGANEIIVNGQIYDHDKRKASYQHVADVMKEINA